MKTSSKPLFVRMRPDMRAALEQLADRNAASLTAELVRIVREELKREGLWPPPAEASESVNGGA